MHEKQVLPVVVVGLTAALVAVIALWTMDRVAGPDQAAASQDGPVEVIEWKLVTTWPKGLPGLGAAPENFARRVNEASGGRLRIKVFGAGEIVPAFEVFDAVSRGVAEAGHGVVLYMRQEGRGIGLKNKLRATPCRTRDSTRSRPTRSWASARTCATTASARRSSRTSA